MEIVNAAWYVTGRVQGVGFRYFVFRQAQSLAVRGWVRNLSDGSVEVQVRGERLSVERFESALREGPGHARVERLVPFPPSGNLERTDAFTIEY
jgi:acylphosphatase